MNLFFYEMTGFSLCLFNIQLFIKSMFNLLWLAAWIYLIIAVSFFTYKNTYKIQRACFLLIWQQFTIVNIDKLEKILILTLHLWENGLDWLGVWLIQCSFAQNTNQITFFSNKIAQKRNRISITSRKATIGAPIKP